MRAPGIDRLDRLDLRSLSDESPSRCAEQRLARKRRLLEAQRDVDRNAGGERLAGCGVAGEDLACVDPDPHPELQPVLRAELRVERDQRFAQVVRRAHRTKRVLLVRPRHSEDGHRGVAHEPLDRAAVAFDDRPDRVEVPPQDRSQNLRIEGRRQACRVHDVGEQDGGRLASLAGRLLGRDRSRREVELGVVTQD